MIYDQEFWRRKPRFSDAVSVVVGQEIGSFYYSHAKLNALFLENGAPEDIPEGSCVTKCVTWLRRGTRDQTTDSFALLGGVLRDFLEESGPGNLYNQERTDEGRAHVRQILEKHGLSYVEGGQVLSAQTSAPTKSLRQILLGRDLPGVHREFDRALEQIEKDPESALTAACSILESLLTTYIEDEGLSVPN